LFTAAVIATHAAGPGPAISAGGRQDQISVTGPGPAITPAGARTGFKPYGLPRACGKVFRVRCTRRFKTDPWSTGEAAFSSARAPGCYSKKKNFFFEKKKQKTFAPALSSPDDYPVPLARSQTDKSFLVLFFKKEHFFLNELPA
jgi:hypothetical protein